MAQPLSKRRVGAGWAVVLVAVLAAGVGVAITVLQRPAPAVSRVIPALPSFQIDTTSVVNAPVSAYGFTVADDPPNHAVLYFGGVGSDDQTWLWDGSGWTRTAPATSPPARALAAATYDPAIHAVVLFGGRTSAGVPLNDTWAWNGAGWERLANGGPPGIGAGLGWDGVHRQMLLVTSRPAGGGETWVWSGSAWLRATAGDLPASPIGSGMATDPLTHALLLVSSLDPPSGAGATTWRWDGASWHRLDTPTPTATIGLAADPSFHRLLICSEPTAGDPPRLWSWSGSRWSEMPGSQLPVQLGAEVADSSHARFLVLGFATPATPSIPEPVITWTWDGRGWHQSG